MDLRVKTLDRNLKKLGYELVRQDGSHMLYKHPKTGATVVLPSARGMQGGEVRRSTARRMLKRAMAGIEG